MFPDKSGLLTLHYGKHHITLVDEIKLWFMDESFTDVVIVCDDDDDDEEEEEEEEPEEVVQEQEASQDNSKQKWYSRDVPRWLPSNRAFRDRCEGRS